DNARRHINLPHLDTVLPQDTKSLWGQHRDMQVNVKFSTAGDMEHLRHLRTRRGNPLLCHHLRSGAYGRSNTLLGSGDSRLQGVELAREILEILTGAGGRQDRKSTRLNSSH